MITICGRNFGMQRHISAATTNIMADLFELQVEELLKDLEKQADANIAKATDLLKKLKDAVEGLGNPKPINVVNPFPPPKDAQYTLEYAKPATINVVGSTASKILLPKNGEIVADMVLIMPQSLFQEKDYRKHRYFHKKAYYTSCILSGLQKTDLKGITYEFSLQNGNILQPCILAKQQDIGTSVKVRIICATSPDIFDENRLIPWSSSPQLNTDGAVSEQLTRKTPFYNSTLRSEMLTLSYLSLIHKVSIELPAFRKAALLFSTWLRQRKFETNLLGGGFGGFEAQALMAMMLHAENGQQPLFRTRYNHIQLFKATLLLLTSKNFVKTPVLYNATTNGGTKATQQLQSAGEDLINGTAACLFDGRRNHNLFFKMSPWSFYRLQRQAEVTIKVMCSSDINKFDHCFISRLDGNMIRYDQIMDVTLTNLFTRKQKTGFDYPEQTLITINALYITLKQALGDRVQEISFSSDQDLHWSPNIDRPRAKKELRINLVLDPQHASRLQDLGPPAENKEAASAFRNFWGSKAELRRFRDGGIQETVVWSNSGSENIITQIVKYILERRHGEEINTAIQEIGTSFWELLPQAKHSKTLAPFEERFKTFQSLEQIIRGLKMPLAIRQISAISPGLRCTALNLDESVKSMEVVIQFESSGSWPDDLEAIQQVKIAFLQKLGDLLTQHNSSIQTRVGLSRNSSTFPRPFLEVIFTTFTFNLIIYHDRELHLLKAHPSETFEDRNLILPELTYHNTTYLRSPLHTQRVRDLCNQYALLSPSIRLFKHWISSHLLTSHFLEETLELLVIHTFTSPFPYGTPSSLRTAFLRTLSHLSKWSWRTEPLFVSLTSDASPTDESEAQRILQTHLEAWRKLDPTLTKTTLLIGSTLDPTGTWWTENSRPGKMVAARLSQLAKAAYTAVLQHDVDVQPEILFTHSPADYDFMLYTQPGPKNGRALSCFIDEVKQIFGETIVWFYGEDLGRIAGLWNRTIVVGGVNDHDGGDGGDDQGGGKWKVGLGYSTIPSASRASQAGGDDGDEEEEGRVARVKSNKMGMLNEIVRLAGDLVVRVDVKES